MIMLYHCKTRILILDGGTLDYIGSYDYVRMVFEIVLFNNNIAKTRLSYYALGYHKDIHPFPYLLKLHTHIIRIIRCNLVSHISSHHNAMWVYKEMTHHSQPHRT